MPKRELDRSSTRPLFHRNDQVQMDHDLGRRRPVFLRIDPANCKTRFLEHRAATMALSWRPPRKP
jgi:hypothetical protein